MTRFSHSWLKPGDSSTERNFVDTAVSSECFVNVFSTTLSRRLATSTTPPTIIAVTWWRHFTFRNMETRCMVNLMMMFFRSSSAQLASHKKGFPRHFHLAAYWHPGLLFVPWQSLLIRTLTLSVSGLFSACRRIDSLFFSHWQLSLPRSNSYRSRWNGPLNVFCKGTEERNWKYYCNKTSQASPPVLTVDSSQISEFRTRIDRFYESLSQELVENAFWLLINRDNFQGFLWYSESVQIVTEISGSTTINTKSIVSW